MKKKTPYQNIIINEFDRPDIISSQIEQWLILRNIVNYYIMDISHSVLHYIFDSKVYLLIGQNNLFIINHKLSPHHLLWLPQV